MTNLLICMVESLLQTFFLKGVQCQWWGPTTSLVNTSIRFRSRRGTAACRREFYNINWSKKSIVLVPTHKGLCISLSSSQFIRIIQKAELFALQEVVRLFESGYEQPLSYYSIWKIFLTSCPEFVPTIMAPVQQRSSKIRYFDLGWLQEQKHCGPPCWSRNNRPSLRKVYHSKVKFSKEKSTK